MRRYAFVDYATQGYTALVGLLILVFHNHTVSNWRILVAGHFVLLLVVHGIIQRHSHGKPGAILDFIRHFYPVILYTAYFCETGQINRMFFPDYLDPTFIHWEDRVFGGQPSVWFMEKLPYLPISELFYTSYFCYYI